MNESEKKMLINKNMTIKDAMNAINQGVSKTVFLVDGENLLGSLTDGDVRRHLINGGYLSENVCKIVNFHPKYFGINDVVDFQKYMIEHAITEIPIVNENNEIVRIECLKKYKKKYKKIGEHVPLIVMAGGLGTRLKPYTDIIPKPLIPVGKKTILEHIFDKFELFGCSKRYVVVNYKKNLIEAYVNDIGLYNEVNFIEEPCFLGTAGGIKLANCKNDFFITNCDILIDADYYDIWKKHKVQNNIITMILAKKNFCVPYGIVDISEQEKILGLHEKPNIEYKVNTGMYLCNAQIYKYMNDLEKIDMPDLIQRCLDAGENVGYYLIDEDNWYDMGQFDELENMKAKMRGLE